MEKRVEDIEASIKMLTSVVEQRTASLNRSKSNMEKRVEHIEASIKKLTSTVDRMVKSVSGAVDKMDRRIFSMQMRLSGIEKHLIDDAKVTEELMKPSPNSSFQSVFVPEHEEDMDDLISSLEADGYFESEISKARKNDSRALLQRAHSTHKRTDLSMPERFSFPKRGPRNTARNNRRSVSLRKGDLGRDTPDANPLSVEELEAYIQNRRRRIRNINIPKALKPQQSKETTPNSQPDLPERLLLKKRKSFGGNQIGKHAWGDMGTPDPQEPPSPKRRRTRAREADRPPTPGIGGKRIDLKNRDQLKSQYKFNLGTIVLRKWTPKPGEFGKPGWHKVKILGRRLRTDKSPKYKVKWHGYPSWDAVPASWVVEENLKESV